MTSGTASASKSSDSAPINPDRELTRLLGALLRRAISTLDSFMMTPIRSCCLIFSLVKIVLFDAAQIPVVGAGG